MTKSRFSEHQKQGLRCLAAEPNGVPLPPSPRDDMSVMTALLALVEAYPAMDFRNILPCFGARRIGTIGECTEFAVS